MDFVEVIISLLFISVLIYFYFMRKFRYWAERGVPFVEPEFPFGNVKGVNSTINMGNFMLKMYNQLKGKDVIGGIYFYSRPVCVPLNLDLIKNILVKDFKYFNDRGWYVNKEADILSGNLFALKENDWKLMRSKLNPTFSIAKLKMMYFIVQKVAQDMVDFLDPIAENKGEVELKDLFSRYTNDIITDTAFGHESLSFDDPKNTFRMNGLKAFEMTNLQAAKMFFLNTFPNVGKKLGMKFWNPEVGDFFQKMLKETIAYREENNIKRNDFLSLLIQLKNSGKLDGDNEDLGQITFDELVAQSFLFFIAGFETSSTTMTYALHELALHEEIQEKVREECQQVFEKYNGVLTYESLSELHYLEQVVKETLRLYPILDHLPRMTTMDYKIPNSKHVIQKGTPIMVPVFGIQRDPQYYPDPEKFDPDRFSPENTAQRIPFIWMPFGEGPRICIGKKFGMIQVKLGLASILLRYKFTSTNKISLPLEFKINSFINVPLEDMLYKVTKI